MKFKALKQLDQKHCIQNYGRHDVAFTRGEGSVLYDDRGREYIDFSSGIGVNSIGHAHAHWVDAVTDQAEKLAHVSNLFYTEPYIALALRLTASSGMNKAFFCNSGAEANEAAIKLARKYSRDKYGEGRSTIITLNKSFHGRTMATVTATGQPGYHKDFTPYLEGFKYINANDKTALKSAITEDVCAVMVEGILGEGGIIPLGKEFVDVLVQITADNDILLIFDEVQTGIGRTGALFHFQSIGIRPDIVTTAKGLGGGLPIGALLVNEKCSGVLEKGTHGSTFGGNLLACAGANAVLDIVLDSGFMEDVNRKGKLLSRGVMSFDSKAIKDVRGKGLMIGIQIDGIDVKKITADLLNKGLVTLTAGSDVLRLLPPLNIPDSCLTEGLDIMKRYFDEVTL